MINICHTSIFSDVANNPLPRLCTSIHSRGDVQLDFGVTFSLQLVEAAGDDGGPLRNKGSNEEVVADGSVAILLQERHQETKADEDHNVHILEH